MNTNAPSLCPKHNYSYADADRDMHKECYAFRGGEVHIPVYTPDQKKKDMIPHNPVTVEDRQALADAVLGPDHGPVPTALGSQSVNIPSPKKGSSKYMSLEQRQALANRSVVDQGCRHLEPAEPEPALLKSPSHYEQALMREHPKFACQSYGAADVPHMLGDNLSFNKLIATCNNFEAQSHKAHKQKAFEIAHIKSEMRNNPAGISASQAFELQQHEANMTEAEQEEQAAKVRLRNSEGGLGPRQSVLAAGGIR